MELKIRIKEVKEETRPLPIEDLALWWISNTNVKGGYPDRFVKECATRLRELGLEQWVGGKDNQPRMGYYRTETIRDATDFEKIAWYCIQTYNTCSSHYRACSGCPINDNTETCLVYQNNNNATKTLKGKEVIIEVVTNGTEN